MEQCAKKLDEMRIPSCGHYTREHGILIRLYCSCRGHQKASMLWFCEEVVFVRQKMLWYDHLEIPDQTCLFKDFTEIRCGSKGDCEVPLELTWKDHAIKDQYVYLVKHKVKDNPAWLINSTCIVHILVCIICGTL